MKKISAILLSVLLIISALAPYALAVDFSQENITVNVVGYKVQVTVTTDADGRMLAYLMNEDKTATYGLDYDAEPSDANGTYTYTFNFKVKKTVPTSKLIIRVGNNVPTTEKVINYANINDKNSFLNGLEAVTDANLVDEYLDTNKAYTSVDIASYLALPENVRTMVSKNIEALNLATGYDNLATETDEYVAGKVAAVSEKETLFNDEFVKSMKCAKLAAANEEQWSTLALAAVTDGLFDGKFFTAQGTTPAFLTVSDVYAAFGTEVSLITELSEAELSNAFDRATLMTVAKMYEYGTVKSAFMYFEDKGTVAVSDMSNIDALIASDKDTELWRNVKLGTYTDCADLVTKTVSMAADLVTNGTTGGTTGDNINNPTSPGGFSGGSLGGGGSSGGSSKPTKPENPKPETPKATFKDIAPVEWAREAIEALAEKGVINGKSEGVYAPNDKVTREEFVKIIIGAFDLLNEDAKADFGDVDASRWSYAFIATANELGIVTGDGESFNPTGAMSRQDMAVVLLRTAEKLGLKLENAAEDFTDAGDIADYAKEAVKALTASGIINGMGDGTFAPKLTVTRAQAAKVIYGLMNLVGGGK